MNAPVHRLTKDEIVWLASHTCKTHHHTYLTHYSCYIKEQPEKDRIAIIDIETSNLKGDYGTILTWALKPLGKKDIIYGVISKADIRKGGPTGTEDKRVTAELIAAMSNFDKVIGYFSKRFDLPFIRTRAFVNKLDFPFFGTIKHIDVFDVVKHRFNLSRKTQENACRVLLGETEKNHVAGPIWREAARGDKKALQYVLDHNFKDVRDLERLYLKVRDFARRNDVSI